MGQSELKGVDSIYLIYKIKLDGSCCQHGDKIKYTNANCIIGLLNVI